MRRAGGRIGDLGVSRTAGPVMMAVADGRGRDAP
jgi:hypothetical protein